MDHKSEREKERDAKRDRDRNVLGDPEVTENMYCKSVLGRLRDLQHICGNFWVIQYKKNRII